MWYSVNALQPTSGLAKLGGKVITRTLARPLTVSDNPNGVQSSSQLRQAAGTLEASGQISTKRVLKRTKTDRQPILQNNEFNLK